MSFHLRVLVWGPYSEPVFGTIYDGPPKQFMGVHKLSPSFRTTDGSKNNWWKYCLCSFESKGNQLNIDTRENNQKIKILGNLFKGFCEDGRKKMYGPALYN